MVVRPLWILVTSLVLQGFKPKEVLGLRNVSLRMIPPAVQRGEHASLICQYDLEGEPLYSVKWYRGRHEFYRYSPSEQPVTKIFPYPGIHVDLSSSNESLVVLRKVGFNLSGNFSCEVTVDAPPFSTKTVTEQLQVVALPENPPTIMTEKERYDPGERLLANCTSPASKPAASLSFLLNDVPGAASGAQSRPAQQHPSAPAVAVAASDLRAVQTLAAQLARELDSARAELSAQRAQLELLREEVAARSDALEQRLKRNALRIFGVAERAGEGSEDAVLRLARRMGVQLRKEDVDSSGRQGPRNGGEPRPLTVNFVSYKKKEQLLRARRKLRNTGIDIVEDLTRTRTDLMEMCVTKFGPRNVWTSEGSVFVKHHRLAKRIASVKDFQNME